MFACSDIALITQRGMLTPTLFKYHYGRDQTMQDCHRLDGGKEPLGSRTTALTADGFPPLWGFVDNKTSTEECRLGFNLTRASEPGCVTT